MRGEERIRLRRATAAALGCALLLGGCARDAEEWRAASAADTPEAYAAFLERYPGSTHAQAARARSAEIAERRAWDAATQSDTAESYRQFLVRHPEGPWAQEARARIEGLAIAAPAAAPVAITAERGNPSGLRASESSGRSDAAALRSTSMALARARAGESVAGEAAEAPAAAQRAETRLEAGAPKAASEPAAVWSASKRIQLGAFGEREKAVAEWDRLLGRFPQQLSGLQPEYVEALSGGRSRVFRLQAEVADAAAARVLCEALRAARQGCIQVPQG